MSTQMLDSEFTAELEKNCRLCAEGKLIVSGYGEVESTMNLAKELVTSADVDKEIIYTAVARSQTAGKGRAGRTWVSVDQQGLYVTFSLAAKDKGPAHWSGFSLAVGVAIRRALKRFNYQVQLKWPNDVVVLAENERGYKKVAGVLIDLQKGHADENWLLVGIGLNISSSECIHVVEGISLEEISQPTPSLAELFSAIAEDLQSCYADYSEIGFEPFIEEWREASIMKGAQVLIDTEQLATVKDIDSKGGLIVFDSTGDETVLYGGEVEVRRVTSS